MPRLLILLLAIARLATASQSQSILSEDPYRAGTESARENANHIFNSIHSAGRQWGSSVQHNGMSFFPATVPEGTLFYHGGGNPSRVTGMEWLAFEVQHAETFSLFFGSHPPVGPPDLTSGEPPPHPRNMPLDITMLQGHLPGGPSYIHIYKTNRELKLLYVDGMSAAKVDLGTLDTQDKVLLNLTLGYSQEFDRALGLCELAEQWGFEGIIRLEAGFELIKCNFSTGLDLVAINERPQLQRDAEYEGQWTAFEYMREVSQRYHGNMAGRMAIDYSYMVSAYFYPTNLSNPDKTSPHPRLIFAEQGQLSRIKSDVRQAIQRVGSASSINWQWVVDMIAARYSDRLRFLATAPPQEQFLSTVNNLLNIFINFSETVSTESLVRTCTSHYLQSVTPFTEQDKLIMAALESITYRICKTLFEVRDLLVRLEPRSHKGRLAMSLALGLMRDLSQWLDWPDWKFCGTCAFDEVCFIAMYPFGTAEDHFHPRCKTRDEIGEKMGNDYWESPEWTLPRPLPTPI